MANSWLRLWHDMPNDPKWRTIARKSGQSIGNVIAVYLHVLVNASSAHETPGNSGETSGDGGVTQGNAAKRGITKNLCTDDIASSLDLDVEQVDQIISAMQGKVLDGNIVTGWIKRQPKREDDSSARVKALRDRKRAEKSPESDEISTAKKSCNAGVTQRNAPDKDPDKDPDKELKDPPLSPPRGKRNKNNFDPLGIDLPVWLTPELWREWVEFRQALRKPIKTSQGVAGSIRELEKFRRQGILPEAVIRYSIANEYQGLFAPGWRETVGAAQSVNHISQPDNTIPDGFRGS